MHSSTLLWTPACAFQAVLRSVFTQPSLAERTVFAPGEMETWLEASDWPTSTAAGHTIPDSLIFVIHHAHIDIMSLLNNQSDSTLTSNFLTSDNTVGVSNESVEVKVWPLDSQFHPCLTHSSDWSIEVYCFSAASLRGFNKVMGLCVHTALKADQVRVTKLWNSMSIKGLSHSIRMRRYVHWLWLYAETIVLDPDPHAWTLSGVDFFWECCFLCTLSWNSRTP